MKRSKRDRRATPGRRRNACNSKRLVDLGGQRFTLRPLRAEDLRFHEQFLASLSDGDLRLRFGRENSRLPIPALARRIQRELARDTVFLATTARPGGRAKIVGEVLARRDPYGARAEFAIAVSSGYQGRGLGRALLEKLVACARVQKVGLLYGLVARSNAAMLAVGRRLGFDVDEVPDADTAVLSLDLEETGEGTSPSSA